jgi:CBS domain-containing protein
MKVRDIMTRHPACCSASTPLVDVAQMMVHYDCGEIPVIDDAGEPIGVITDRDITCRVVAQNKSASELKAEDCMTSPCVTVSVDDDVRDCVGVLESYMIRRAPVIDAQGRCCGIVSQADIARMGDEHDAAELVREVSRPIPPFASFI